jgi:ABC-type protease/lipase transport system fused ATPase/permease subunit
LRAQPQPIPEPGSNVVPLRRDDVDVVPPTEFMPWGEFLRYFQQEWHQGEHVTMIGTTGSGKTTLLEQVIGIRSYVAIFGVKGRDDTMERFMNDHKYTRIKRGSRAGQLPRPVARDRVDTDIRQAARNLRPGHGCHLPRGWMVRRVR